MIYLYIILGIIIVLTAYPVIKRIRKLRITWNEHKSVVFDLDTKTSYLIAAHNAITRKQNELINNINNLKKDIKRRSNNLENKINAIQYELLLDHLEKTMKEKKDNKEISLKTYEEFKKITHNRKMDNRIKELLNKK